MALASQPTRSWQHNKGRQCRGQLAYATVFTVQNGCLKPTTYKHRAGDHGQDDEGDAGGGAAGGRDPRDRLSVNNVMAQKRGARKKMPHGAQAPPPYEGAWREPNGRAEGFEEPSNAAKSPTHSLLPLTLSSTLTNLGHRSPGNSVKRPISHY